MCDCITYVNAKLAERNTQIMASISFAKDDMSDSMEVPVIATEKVDTKKRGRPAIMVPTFCPFCGTKYPKKGAANG